MNKKLMIIGCYPIKYEDINWDNYDKVWGVASCLFIDKLKYKLTEIFEVHRYSEYIQDTYSEIYKTDLPVYMQKKDKKVKNCLIFPFDNIFKKYGTFFTNSKSLMLCFAVMEGYKDISIYGIEMETNRESMIEKDNLSYWVGFFRGQGITINIQKESWLCRNVKIYGVDNILGEIKKINDKIKFYKRLEKDSYYSMLDNTYLYKKTNKLNFKKRKILLNRIKLYGEKVNRYSDAVEVLEWTLRTI